MSREIELLMEIRDLLKVMAEPALIKQDEKFKQAVQAVAGKSRKSGAAILLMDGSRTQAAISKQASIDPSQLNRLVKTLEANSLIGVDEKYPKLRVKLSPSFFDQKGRTNE